MRTVLMRLQNTSTAAACAHAHKVEATGITRAHAHKVERGITRKQGGDNGRACHPKGKGRSACSLPRAGGKRGRGRVWAVHDE